MFDDIRNKSKENMSAKKFKLGIDHDDAFDYDAGSSDIFNIHTLTSDIIQEVIDINSERKQELIKLTKS